MSRHDKKVPVQTRLLLVNITPIIMTTSLPSNMGLEPTVLE